MTDELDAARERLVKAEEAVRLARLDINAALAAMADSGLTSERVAEAAGISDASARKAIAAHRRLHPKPASTRPPARYREKGQGGLMLESHPSAPGTARPVVAESPARPPGVEWARERPAAVPEPNPNPDEVDF